MIRILGADPGTRVLGFGLIGCPKHPRFSPGRCQVLDAGLIRAKASVSHGRRIGCIHNEFYHLLDRLQPDHLYLESAFFGLNAQSALRLGEVRGAMISAAARLSFSFSEISPTSMKKTIAGNGHATKDQVAHGVCSLLNIRAVSSMPADVTDALGIALCGALKLTANSEVFSAPGQ